jgi:hypothetical protein
MLLEGCWLLIALGHHVGFRAVGRALVGIIVLVVIVATVEVARAFVLIGATMLLGALEICWPLLSPSRRGTYVLVSTDQVAHVGRRVLVELLVVAKDEDGDIDGAEHRELMRLLEETALALEESDWAVAVILDGLDLNLPSTHLDCVCA